MGCVSASEKRANHQIKAYLQTVEKRNDVKMVLLGAGGTGKSTLFKSIKISHNGGDLPLSDKRNQAQTIYFDILRSMTTLISQCNKLYEKNSVLYKDCQIIPHSNAQQVTDSFMKMCEVHGIFFEGCTDDEFQSWGQCIESVWNLDCIQATYNHRFNNFAMNDNLRHFCDNSRIKSIFSADYIPTTQDYLLNRYKTSGAREYKYSLPASDQGVRTCFKLMDPGGVRSERRRWIECFDKLRCFIH